MTFPSSKPSIIPINPRDLFIDRRTTIVHLFVHLSDIYYRYVTGSIWIACRHLAGRFLLRFAQSCRMTENVPSRHSSLLPWLSNVFSTRFLETFRLRLTRTRIPNRLQENRWRENLLETSIRGSLLSTINSWDLRLQSANMVGNEDSDENSECRRKAGILYDYNALRALRRTIPRSNLLIYRLVCCSTVRILLSAESQERRIAYILH